MNALGRRWDFLRPWCVPVRGMLELYHYSTTPSVPPMPYKAIELEFLHCKQEPTPVVLRAIRDALVLLALVAHVDFAAYKYMLTEHCSLDMDGYENDADEEDFRKARFRLVLDHTDPWTMLHGLLADLDAPPSAPFAMTARKIAGYRVL